MSARDKFGLGEYVNVSPDLMVSFRFACLLKGRFAAGKVVGYSVNPYYVRLQLDGKPGVEKWHMDDWEKP